MTQRILIVDDAPASLRMAERMISGLGYAATAAATGAMAIALVEQGQRFDLLFTDLIMPDIDGYELAREIRLRDPAILVLFTSGDLMSKIDEVAFDASYLAKPYRKAEIADVLREMLK